MNSISIKIKVAALIGIATLVGIVLYVKADRASEDASLDASYGVSSSVTTNLNAVMKAHPRTSEYTSSEYTSKMAPGATQASEYLALYESLKAEDYSYQQAETGEYKRKSVPSKHIDGQRPAQSRSAVYESYGVRSTVVNNDSIIIELEEDIDIEEEEEEVDPRLQIATDVKQRIVGVDSYSRAVTNAETNDNAYQMSDKQSSENPYKGYAVRSADRGKDGYISIAEDGYTRKSAPQGGGSSQSVKSYAQENNSGGDSYYGGYAVRSAGGKDVETAQQSSSDKTNAGYAVRSVGSNSLTTVDTYARKRAPQMGESTTSLAQYDNAKGNDRAYQNPTNGSQSSETYGGYAVRSAGKKSSTQNMAATEGEYMRKRAPQGANGTAIKENEYGGYAVRSAGNKSSVSSASNNMTIVEGGYTRKRAPVISGENSTSLAQYDNASKNDGAYKVQNTSSEETYGGYAVRSAGKKSNKSTTANTAEGYARKRASQGGYGQNGSQQAANITSKSARPRGGVPASTGLKVYGNRGERLAAETPQKDRSVIVMPKRGRSVAGVVIQDDPGRSIIVQSTSGIQSTYRYGEIDALVNL